MNNEHFARFLDAIDDYLYKEGWFINGHYIKLKCKTFDEVTEYLVQHCYSQWEAEDIVAKLKLQTL